MSSHNEQVEPTRFDIATPAPTETTAASTTTASTAAAATPSWVIPALGGLLLLAVVVFFVLPSLVGPSTEPVAEHEAGTWATSPNAISPSPPAEETASPWSDAQLSKLRKEAQDALAELLEIQPQLEESAVELWADEAFTSAKNLATTGDAQFRERDYVAAKTSYESARDAMQALLLQRPEAAAQQLSAATEAIEAGNAETARTALDIAARIDPLHAELAALEARLTALAPVQELLASAKDAEQAGDLATAEKDLKRAVSLDPAHQFARAELARVSADYKAQQFTQAMSDGYQALDEGRFDAARSAFAKAGKLTPNSQEVASALQEVGVAQTASRLTRLQQSGTKAEDSERWQDAVNAYEEAIKIDSTISFAQQGLDRSRGRAKLDSQFRTAIAEPTRLSEPAVAKAMEGLLQQASAIAGRGPVLTAQLSKLESLLKLANTPLAVTLRSDGQTDVTVYKVAKLGLFQQHQLSLRPGAYTAVGIRNGYRDVRVTFTLTHDAAPADVLIRCTEKI